MYKLVKLAHLINGDNMKKRILLLISIFIFIIVGCELNNNPTSKIEELLGKYQGLDKNIEYNENNLINTKNLSKDIIDEYKEIIKKQYRNLVYEIKEETIDGENAIVTVEIEVLDYKKVLDKNDITNITVEEHKQIIKELKKEKDKITYTIDFTTTKDKNGNWHINPLTEEQKQKLLGNY